MEDTTLEIAKSPVFLKEHHHHFLSTTPAVANGKSKQPYC